MSAPGERRASARPWASRRARGELTVGLPVVMGAVVAILLGPIIVPGVVDEPASWLVRATFLFVVGGMAGALIDRLRGGSAVVPARVALEATDDSIERQKASARAERLEMFDPLTDLPNRTLFVDRLRIAVRQARQARSELGVVHVGMNGFKAVNEALGRSAGDRVLKVIADRMLDVTREGDSVARLSGDEFAVILGDPINALGAWHTAGKILGAIAAPIELGAADGREITVEASGGLAIYPTDGDDETSLLHAAGLALHEAKRTHVSLAVYTDEQDELARTQWTRLAELREALEGNQLIVHYQPVFSAARLELLSTEALVRWEHPTAGLLGPDEFIPLAEGSGLIDEVARQVLRIAALQAVAWAAAGTPLATAINISQLNLHNASVLGQLMSILDETGLDPALMKIEITESAIMFADEPALEALARLRARGVRVAIDDFGTGYSSLSLLRSLPMDEIKLDHSFVRRMRHHGPDRQIVRSIIELAHNLGLDVTAEGVEDRATLTLLQQMECDAVQGFLTGRPVEAHALARSPALMGAD